MPTKSIIQKMRVMPGFKLLILNPPKGYIHLLGEMPDGARILVSSTEPADVIQAFVQSQAEVEQNIHSWNQMLKPDGIIWLTYPKLTSGIKADVNRDIIWKQIKTHGFDAVSMIAIDETWSAMRLKKIPS